VCGCRKPRNERQRARATERATERQLNAQHTDPTHIERWVNRKKEVGGWEGALLYQECIRKGLKSKHKDFEDALQILCAGSIQKMDCIVTRNIKDFKDADIPVISPEKLKL
jgi:hypothetical protein